MKAIDDTPVPESESEQPAWIGLVEMENKMNIRILRLEKRIADLERRFCLKEAS